MFLEAEAYTEKLTSPDIGKVARLRHGPLVEANLALYRATDSFQYQLGLDYMEVASGGFLNKRISAGITVRAEYFYHAEPGIGEGGGIFVPQESAVPLAEETVEAVQEGGAQAVTSGARYASVLKYGGGV